MIKSTSLNTILERQVKPMNINQLFVASRKVLENANELVEEADLLLRNNRFARAFTLAHLACEELVKLQIFYTIAVEVARGHDINWKTMGRQLNKHQVKIRWSVFVDFLRKSPQGNADNINELFQLVKASEVNLNKLKNDSLYASQIGNDFVKPSEIISREEATQCITRAREQLQIAQLLYSAIYTLTGMTEEGLRRFIELPEFQNVIQLLESITGPSNAPPVTNEEQVVAELTEVLSNPTIQFWLNQLSIVTESLMNFNEQMQ